MLFWFPQSSFVIKYVHLGGHKSWIPHDKWVFVAAAFRFPLKTLLKFVRRLIILIGERAFGVGNAEKEQHMQGNDLVIRWN